MGKSCAGNEYYKDDEISVEEIKAVNGTVKCKEAVGPKDAPMELMEQDSSLYIFISNISSFKETAEKRLVYLFHCKCSPVFPRLCPWKEQEIK